MIGLLGGDLLLDATAKNKIFNIVAKKTSVLVLGLVKD